MDNLFVVLLGIGTVFTGLIAIIILCKVISWCCNLNRNKSESLAPAPTAVTPAAPVVPVKAVIPNRGEVVAAIATAIAEDLGTDVSAIRILSIEQM